MFLGHFQNVGRRKSQEGQFFSKCPQFLAHFNIAYLLSRNFLRNAQKLDKKLPNLRLEIF